MKKRILLLALAAMPLSMLAQTDWERPLTAAEKKELAKKAEAEAKKAAKEAKKEGENTAQPKDKTESTPQETIKESDRKYIVDAVPEVDGKVVFTLDLDVPGKSAEQIYDITYSFLDNMVQEAVEGKEGGIKIFNKTEHTIAAKYYEWLNFSKSFLSNDRTELDYTIIAKCTDGHLLMTMERISYNYEEGSPAALKTTAEEWITDRNALNKKKTRLQPGFKKFRVKTIDRKDEIFEAITLMLQ